MLQFFITHLYPQEMSIYGDMGNVLAVRYRLEKRGFEVIYQIVEVGDRLPDKTDFYFIGGGQDNEQYLIFHDLLEKKDHLLTDIESGVSLLSICGGYQLLGESFLTGDGREIQGIGLFPVRTIAPDISVKSRCVGNLIVECQIPDLQGYKLIGFENHGGQTYFTKHSSEYHPLGKTLTGFGNNAKEKLEGCVYKNAIGTYLHGSCLPKNPLLADWLIKQALISRGLVDLERIDDSITERTRSDLINRFL